MALVKRADAANMARQAIVLDLGDLRRQADELKARASQEAEQIKADALTERDRIISGVRELAREAGQKQGYGDGLIEGREAGRAEAVELRGEELDTIIQAWTSTLDQLDTARTDLVEQTRRDLLALVIEIASRVTRKLVELDDSAVLPQLEAALAMVIEPTRIVVEINPEDRALVETALPALISRFAGGANAQLVDASEISRGSCILRTEHGRIDASIETQIQRITEALLGADPQSAVQPEAQTEDTPADPDEQQPPIEDRSAA